jgi:hypothetical protein
MAEKHPIDAEIALEVDWPPVVPEGTDRVRDASLGRFSLRFVDQILTSYKSDKGDVGSHVEIPTFDLAEWIASNWWPLLFEPPKSDTDDTTDYLHRHWLGAARSGFALPDVTFAPAGDRIEVTAKECYLRFARLAFLENATGSVSREAFQGAFAAFVEGVLDRLTKSGVSDTSAHEAWQLIKSTDKDAEDYCRLVGSLGLCPYDEHPEIDAILEQVSSALDGKMVADICEASDSQSLRRVAAVGEKLTAALPYGQAVDFSCLASIDAPSDHSLAAYRWGLDGTRLVRQHFGISSRDPTGSASFFEKLGFDVGKAVSVTDNSTDLVRIPAAFARDDDFMKVALGEPREAQRRFTAARAAFLGWIEGDDAKRFVTGARTRNQQASRAFAAELLAPISYIQSRTGGRTISTYRIDEIAEELHVSPAVVRYQAQNNRMHVAESW